MMVRWKMAAGAAAVTVMGLMALRASAQQSLGYSDTPLLPGGKWHVHDGVRPQPRVVDPGPAGEPVKAPSDAVVLFDGKDLSKFRFDKADATWTLQDGYVQVKAGVGTMTTRQEFGDCQIHLEFATPAVVVGSGQGRGNSGVFLLGRYEMQVMDSYQNPTYADGSCAAVYGQFPPLVNASRKPGEWQTYDIFFTVPVWTDGKLTAPGHVTIIHNGIVVQNHTEILGGVSHRALPTQNPHGPKGPLAFQDHGSLVRYRNIWVREFQPTDRN